MNAILGTQMRDPINSELTRNPVSKHQVQPECGESACRRGTGRPNPSRETKFSGANGDRREIFIFPVQLTTCRISNHTPPVDPYSCHVPGRFIYVITINK